MSRKVSISEGESSCGIHRADQTKHQLKESEQKIPSSSPEKHQEPTENIILRRNSILTPYTGDHVKGHAPEPSMDIAIHHITSGSETMELKDALDLEMTQLRNPSDLLASPSIDVQSQIEKESSKSLVVDSQWLQAM